LHEKYVVAFSKNEMSTFLFFSFANGRRMTRQNETLCLLLVGVLLAAPVQAKEAMIGEKETIGGLTCFSISPPTGPDAADIQKAKSCKALCADQGAACSGVTSNLSPIPSCEESAAPSAMVCRCCKVDK
jgi:hypothetical protein